MDFLLLQPHPGQEIEILPTDITGPILDSSLAPRRNMLLGVCAREGFLTKLLSKFPLNELANWCVRTLTLLLTSLFPTKALQYDCSGDETLG